jgi:peptide-methionine (S)-S-oxide reductase
MMKGFQGEAFPEPISNLHAVGGVPLKESFKGVEEVAGVMVFFGGAESEFWELTNVFTTSIGYAGEYTPNPTYGEVCNGVTWSSSSCRNHARPKQSSFS